MIQNSKLCVIIPARSGSKGIPNKNIREIAGKSLLFRTLETATGLTDIKNICLSTDSEKYYQNIKDEFNPIFLKRSPELSTDTALAIKVWKDAIKFLKNNYENYEYSIWLEPSSPMRNLNWLKEITRNFIKSSDDLWMSIKETDSKFRLEKQLIISENGEVKNLFKNDDFYSLRQNSSKTYHKDGVFYIARNKYIMNCRGLFEGKIKGLINNFKSINIDTFDDLEYAKYLLKD